MMKIVTHARVHWTVQKFYRWTIKNLDCGRCLFVLYSSLRQALKLKNVMHLFTEYTSAWHFSISMYVPCLRDELSAKLHMSIVFFLCTPCTGLYKSKQLSFKRRTKCHTGTLGLLIFVKNRQFCLSLNQASLGLEQVTCMPPGNRTPPEPNSIEPTFLHTHVLKYFEEFTICTIG